MEMLIYDQNKKNIMLYVIATPIGNIGDITKRAIETLESVDIVACEDTRRTGRLLSHLGFKKKLIAYNDFNSRRKTSQLLELLEEGNSIAIVSDAGTPCISDPGFLIVRECQRKGIQVSPIAGPSAIIAALSASGFPTDKFTFQGFVPKGPGKKKKFFEQFLDREETIVFYESPHRILKTLAVIDKVMPNWQVCLARELTKRFEKFYYGTAKELIDVAPSKGEYVVLLSRIGTLNALPPNTEFVS